MAASILSGHPTVIDVVRIAERLSNSTVEIVVFEGGRAIIVGSLGRQILQPRRLTEAETELCADGGDRPRQRRGAQGTSFPITGPAGALVGAISVGPDADALDADVFHGLSRICTSLILDGHSPTSTHESVLDNLRDAVIVIDENAIVTYANSALAIQIGRSPQEVLGANIIDYIHPEDMALAADAMVRLATGAEVYRTVVRVSHASGEYVRQEVTGRDMSHDPRIGGVVLSLRNGERDTELEDALERTQRLSGAILEQLHDGIVATDAVGSVLIVNHAARHILGIPTSDTPAEIQIEGLRFLGPHGAPLPKDVHPVRRVATGETISAEQMSVITDGHVRSVLVSGRPVTDIAGSIIGSVLGFHDVTEAHRAERELLFRALHDQLTGLPNRRQLEERLQKIMADANFEDQMPVAGCLIDLDNFKMINDTHGHSTGDSIIRAAAKKLALGRKPEDLLVRLGGDEFVVLLRTSSTEEALKTAEEMRQRLAEPFEVDDKVFNLTSSIGVALLDTDALNEDSLLRRADVALYAAKARGRNCVALFDDELADAARAAQDQRAMLRRAIDEDELIMHFQPLIDSSTNEIVALESLARCRTAAGELVGPSEFLSAAAGSGLVWELDKQAFALTCASAEVITEAAPKMIVACNFSALSIIQPDFVEYVEQTLLRHNVSPSTICIEITETAAFDAGPIALRALHALHQRGMQLALDDFGTGYSSLAHLRDLPLSIVKVDQSFVAQLQDGSAERSIAQAVVHLTDDLGMSAVAEGVQTEEQFIWAQSIGFTIMQGWYFSAAVDLDAVVDLIRKAPARGAFGEVG